MKNQDTIAAIATGTSNAGISIIRISGADAFAVADAIFVSNKGKKKLAEQKSHTLHYGMIMDGEVMVDEVLVSVMKAPNTYTTENIVEINCHGGMIVTKKILELVLLHGARIAEPGEFTKRAFLNGRMDLSQAEAVIDLIHATNEQAVKNSVRQLNGNLCRKIKEIRDSVLRDTAFIEAALDDPEHISLEGYPDELLAKDEEWLQELKKLLKS